MPHDEHMHMPAAGAGTKNALDVAHDDDCGCDECKGKHDKRRNMRMDMDMERDTMLRPRLDNMPHQHAMTLVGHETVFAVHMTQFYMEEHKYQLVFEVSLPDWVSQKLDKARRKNPKDWFVLSNDEHDRFTVPDLACGRKRSYRAKIFQGLPPFDDEEEANPHFYPWSPDRVIPLIKDFAATVERIVTFRPFAHNLQMPDFATYLLFGKGGEAHMTNLQTGRLASSPFEALAFGPDYDHVLSLDRRPDGLADAQLEAGIVVTLPAIRLRDQLTGAQTVPGKWPFKKGDNLQVLYRGILPEFTVIAGETYLFGTAVCSSAATLRADQQCLDVSATPGSLLKKK